MTRLPANIGGVDAGLNDQLYRDKPKQNKRKALLHENTGPDNDTAGWRPVASR